jgi:hypothetical protein
MLLSPSECIGSDPRCPIAGRIRGRGGVASDEDDLILVGKDRTSRVAADEAARARDRDLGHSIDTVVAGRRRPLGALPRS